MTANGYQELPFDYTNWNAGEPNNYRGTSNYTREACVHAWKSNEYNWNDESCLLPICYVCEYDI